MKVELNRAEIIDALERKVTSMIAQEGWVAVLVDTYHMPHSAEFDIVTAEQAAKDKAEAQS